MAKNSKFENAQAVFRALMLMLCVLSSKCTDKATRQKHKEAKHLHALVVYTMMIMMMYALTLVSFFLFPSSFIVGVNAQLSISPQQLYAGMQNGDFAAVVDVRSRNEWVAGHIENATFVENLASSSSADIGSILGCETCAFAVYCTVGQRAGNAIQKLKDDYGFAGILYNAGGTSQWTGAGFPLVTIDQSKTPKCSQQSDSPGICACCSAEEESVDGQGGNNGTSIDDSPTPSTVESNGGESNSHQQNKQVHLFLKVMMVSMAIVSSCICL